MKQLHVVNLLAINFCNTSDDICNQGIHAQPLLSKFIMCVELFKDEWHESADRIKLIIHTVDCFG